MSRICANRAAWRARRGPHAVRGWLLRAELNDTRVHIHPEQTEKNAIAAAWLYYRVRYGLGGARLHSTLVQLQG